MSRNLNVMKKKAVSLSPPGNSKKARSKLLSFSDLEIPVEPLLTREQEFRSGKRIKIALRRLAKLLPRHPSGYRRFIARMDDCVSGGALMFSWLSVRESMRADHAVAVKALDKAESLAAKSPGRAVAAFEDGVRLLLKYPLDPETVFQWSREAVAAPRTPAFRRIERFRKVERALRKVVQTLERERDHLVMPNFRLVLKEVFRYHPTGMKRSDLFQEGILGLHKAVFR